MIPGEVFPAAGEIELNAGRQTVRVTVANTGDRPVQVGSHYHFAETNPGLSFDRDAAGSGKSVCNGPCATNWPPLMAAQGEAASGDFSIVTRDDGSKQWAVKGKPVYYWVKDSKPGDKTGDGFSGVWQVAKP